MSLGAGALQQGSTAVYCSKLQDAHTWHEQLPEALGELLPHPPHPTPPSFSPLCLTTQIVGLLELAVAHPPGAHVVQAAVGSTQLPIVLGLTE